MLLRKRNNYEMLFMKFEWEDYLIKTRLTKNNTFNILYQFTSFSITFCWKEVIKTKSEVQII